MLNTLILGCPAGDLLKGLDRKLLWISFTLYTDPLQMSVREALELWYTK